MDPIDREHLYDLARRVGLVERKIDFILQSLKLDFKDDAVPTFPQVQEWLRKGNKIEAIKAYRRETGKGLKESKDAVDEMEKRMTKG
ncbi:MAG: ribosomal protein L7/L12 [Chloroflexi bacterium]|nr:ribosomal protein L7/L12 [Chloroflexota bacterium]